MCGVEAWYSYSTPYSNQVWIRGSLQMTASITNEFGAVLLTNRIVQALTNTINPWRGWLNAQLAAPSFVLPFGTNQTPFLPSATYTNLNAAQGFAPLTHVFQRGTAFPVPRWTLNLNTKLLFILWDTQAQHIVDYVNLSASEQPLDVMAKLSEGGDCSTILQQFDNLGSFWCTNRLGGRLDINTPTYGIINQIMVALNGNDNAWRSFSFDPYSGNNVHHAVDFFRFNLLGLSPIFNNGLPVYKTNVFYAPFSPYRPIFVHNTWQANDPLVHYTVGDLTDLSTDPTNKIDFTSQGLADLGQINSRFEPWGGNPRGARSSPDIPARDPSAKDPLVQRPDDWDFPTNKYPNVGWVGRVHRGTPWQTLFLKSTNLVSAFGMQAGLQKWRSWTGNPYRFDPAKDRVNPAIYSNIVDDAALSFPTNDWRILDLFTAAPNDNATRGRLSVNQTNLAAWSAVLSGVYVLNDITNGTTILPAGAYTPQNPTPLARIVGGINRTRATMPGGSFQHLGDVFATPELTMASPYITNANAVVNDAVYERIPQQIAGLLQGGEPPRFTIYSWGQTLKPAQRGVVTHGGPFFGLVTNYTITAEVATKAVIRIDGAPNNPKPVIESYTVLPPE